MPVCTKAIFLAIQTFDKQLYVLQTVKCIDFTRIMRVKLKKY